MRIREFSEISHPSFLKEIFLSKVIPVYLGFRLTKNKTKASQSYTIRVEHTVAVKHNEEVILYTYANFSKHHKLVGMSGMNSLPMYDAIFSKTDSILRMIEKWREWNE